MVDMRSSELERKEMVSVPSKGPKYPHGLKICLDSETLKKLGLSDIPEVGKKVKFLAEAEVISVNKEDEEGDEQSLRIDLQIVDMELEKKKQEKGIVDTLYKG